MAGLTEEKVKAEKETAEKAVKAFNEFRSVLRVPLQQDLQDLESPEFPADRRWKGECLGYSVVDAVRIAKKTT